MKPVSIPLEFTKGDDASLHLLFTAGGTPFDLTGWTFSASVRPQADPNVAPIEEFVVTLGPGVGEMTLRLEEDFTSTLPRRAYWSLRAYHVGTDLVQTWLAGNVRIDYTAESDTTANEYTIDVGADDIEVVAAANVGPTGATGAQGAPGLQGVAGEGVPPGGTTGQSLVKATATDFDTEWSDVAGGSGGAPTDAGYLVSSAHAGLSGEVVVGTTPQGELGGTWSAPTVDTTHAGSAHLALGSGATQAATGNHAHSGTYEPAGTVATHSADTTDVHGIADTSTLATTAYVSSTINDHSVLNVMDYGATGDGTTDDTAAIVAAIAAAPVRTSFGQTLVPRPEKAVVIFFPTPASFYRITSRIDIPTNKLVRLLGESSHSARIRLDAASGDYAFRVLAGDGQRPCSFEKLIFHQCGIEYETTVRRYNTVRDCTFVESPDWAIRTLGMSVIQVSVENCLFTECVGGINVAYEQSDIWHIADCAFVRNTGVDVRIATSGVHVTDCDFEVKPDASSSVPFVQIANDPTGVRPGNDLVFQRCRFGNEVNPPRDCVVVGPIDGTRSTSATGAIWFDACVFRGANGGTPTSTQGKTAIKFSQQPYGIRVTDCEFFVYENLVEEDYVAGGSTFTGSGYYNIWRGNTGTLPTGKVFTQGGRGWTVEGPLIGAGRVPAQYQRVLSRNLLARTANIDSATSWIKTNLTVAKDATGPDGVASSAYTLTKSATGSAHLRSSAAGVTTSVTFSVWLKAGTTTEARMEILSGTNSHLTPFIEGLRLDGVWRRYQITAHDVNPAGETLNCYVYAGYSTSATGAGDTILYANPQLEEGAGASPYRSNPDTGGAVTAAAPFQSLTLGYRMLGWGTAAPTTGRYEVGDHVINSAPTSSSNVGWVCTTAGAPGTWTSWGAPAPALDTEAVQDIVGGMVTGGTETGITVGYDDVNGRLDFVVTGAGVDDGVVT